MSSRSFGGALAFFGTLALDATLSLTLSGLPYERGGLVTLARWLLAIVAGYIAARPPRPWIAVPIVVAGVVAALFCEAIVGALSGTFLRYEFGPAAMLGFIVGMAIVSAIGSAGAVIARTRLGKRAQAI